MKRIIILYLTLCLLFTSCGIGMRPAEIPHETVRDESPSDRTEQTGTNAVPETKAVKESESVQETESAPETEAVPETESPPTEEELLDAAAAKILAGMTAEEKLGQMFICAYEDGISPAETADLGFSGYLFFQYDFYGETPESFSSALADLQNGSEFGLLFAVDEEGGSVVRASMYPEFRDAPFQSPRDIYASSGSEGLYADALDKGQHLASLGINFNLAPVADIATDPASFIYDRSVGISGSELTEALLAITKGQRESGIASCVKHFPGYGSAEDTHKVMAADHRPLEELEAYDLVPFYALCEDGIEAVMVSHIFVDAIDSTRPASVSAKTVEYIRDRMNYDGIIMTDDLAMAGITEFCQTGNAALEAVLAGYDLLCCTNWEIQYDAVLDAVKNGTVTEERLNESVARILRLKHQLGLWDVGDYLE